MSDPKTNFFLTGATGYIGGSVLARFLAHPHAGMFQFTVLVRDHNKAEKLKELGVNAVVGSHTDAALVERLASEADVVIAAADVDDLGAAKATLAGLKKRHALGVVPIFINTSGTGVISDDAKGMHSDATIYDDSDADQMETIAPTQMHRDVDLAITAADAEGYTKSYIILPSTIYGLATGRLVDMGIQNPHSLQIPSLISAALDRGQAGMVGEGKNLWPNVEIHELADLYTTLYDKIISDADTGHGRNGFYFGASGEHSLYDVGKAIGKALVALGKSQSDQPITFTQAELDKYFGGSAYLGSNSRCRATHSLSIGWKPVKTTKDMLASTRPEVEAIIKKRAGPA
ncbi:NAD(P)-binding protein [Mycena albidolilacea]|uniref:NAD(P)-binding protein n=1 Tax=Mycena albidolilacea TaxID=1033008 RepID=A0AAD7EE67_9AGAR|nr:NAD(P)-binding protein [Mycena albidolilacea]